MKMSEKEIKEFEKQNIEICKLVTPIKEKPEMVAATKKWSDLKNKLDEINVKLIALGSTKSDANKDGRNILEGRPLDTLASQQNLEREKSGLVAAIELQAQKIREIQISLSRAGCEQLKEVAEKFFARSFDALERAATALKQQENWLNYISRKGYKIGMRPANWVVTHFEQNFLMTINRHLKDRRTAWGIKRKNHKS